MNHLKKRAVILLVIGTCVFASAAVTTLVLVVAVPERKTAVSSVSRTFRFELMRRARERGVVPVEGFDAQILLREFPGLEEADFDGVVTGGGPIEGTYYFLDGKLQWQQSASSRRSSAKDSVLSEGYGTLLSNLARRLEVTVSQENQVKSIVDIIDTKRAEKVPINE